MSNRLIVIALAAAGLFIATPGCNSNMSKKECEDKKEWKEKDEKDEHDEQKVSIDQLPAAVVATAKKELPDGKITDADKEMKHGMTIYEMDIMSGGTNFEIKTKEDGTFISKKVDDEKDEHDEKK